MLKKINILLAIMLITSSFFSVSAEERVTASTMKVEAVEGTVSVKNQTGKNITVREGMRFLSGYSITTDAASYVHISLDDNKVIKLDGLTSCTVSKKGDNIEILLVSGKLLYDVDAPLKTTETMSIRTSTLVTGIRGTVGLVEVVSDYETIVTVYEGVVQSTATNTFVDHIRETTQSGQKSTAIKNTSTNIVEFVDEVVEEREVPGFAAKYISNDIEVSNRIREKSSLDVDEIIEFEEENTLKDEALQELLSDDDDDDDDDDDFDDDDDDDIIINTDFDSIIVDDDDDDFDDDSNSTDNDDNSDIDNDIEEDNDDSVDENSDLNDNDDDSDSNDSDDDLNDDEADENDNE